MSIKHIAGALTLSLALGVAACGGDDSSSSDSGDSAKKTSGSTATKAEGPVKIAFSAPGSPPVIVAPVGVPVVPDVSRIVRGFCLARCGV